MFIFYTMSSGGEDKLERIHRLYYKKMYLLSYRILKDHYMAEDAVQISYIKILNLWSSDINLFSV